MNKYVVRINASNFEMREEEKRRKFGFFTTRYIEAEDHHEAGSLAVEHVKKEFEQYMLNDKEDPPYFNILEMAEVETFDGKIVPGTEASWYPEDQETKGLDRLRQMIHGLVTSINNRMRYFSK